MSGSWMARRVGGLLFSKHRRRKNHNLIFLLRRGASHYQKAEHSMNSESSRLQTTPNDDSGRSDPSGHFPLGVHRVMPYALALL